MRFFRVIPLDESADPKERGGALFVPPGGASRIDNPDLYRVLYLALNPEAAIAETFGRIPVWSPDTFVHGSGRAYRLVAYRTAESLELFNLNDVDSLKSIGIDRPSAVVTRDRVKTQAWARSVFGLKKYAGATWWSYYNPDWAVAGLWDQTGLVVDGAPTVLGPQAEVVRDTARTIVRQLVQ